MIRSLFLILISGLVLAGLPGGSLLIAQEAVGQDAFQSTQALIDLLKARGNITEDEAGAFEELFLGFQDTGRLIDLLKARGNITEDEAGAFEKLFLTPRKPKTAVKQPATAAPVHRDVPEPDPKPEVIAPVDKPADSDATHTELLLLDEKLENLTTELKRQRDLSNRERKLIKKQIMIEQPKKAFHSNWVDRIRFGGDIRLRYQKQFYDGENADLLDPSDPNELLNTKNDRDRFRYRTRVNMTAKLVDGGSKNLGNVEAGIRLSTGNDDNPVSTNDTLGDYQNKDDFLVDRAYLKWTYLPGTIWWGLEPKITFTGGRIPNPWFYTNLVWDHDLNFEGMAVTFESDNRDFSRWNSFLSLGAFPLQEEKFSSRDKWLYGVQIGGEYRLPDLFKGTLGIAYYDYYNIEGVVNNPALPGETDFTAPLYQQKGNTLIDIDPSAGIRTALATDYNLLNATLKADIEAFSPIHLIFWADFVMNIGYDEDEVIAKTGISDIGEETMGYQIGAQVGYPKIRLLGEWKSYLFYRYVESDAVIDAFTDSDFLDGGTNARGWIFGCEFGLYKDVWMALKLQSGDEIIGPQVASDLLQLDLNARF